MEDKPDSMELLQELLGKRDAVLMPDGWAVARLPYETQEKVRWSWRKFRFRCLRVYKYERLAQFMVQYESVYIRVTYALSAIEVRTMVQEWIARVAGWNPRVSSVYVPAPEPVIREVEV